MVSLTRRSLPPATGAVGNGQFYFHREHYCDDDLTSGQLSDRSCRDGNESFEL